MKKPIEGVVEFKNLIKELISKGISYYRLSRIFKIPAAKIINIFKNEDRYPTITDLAALENIGYKAMVVVFKENDEETYRVLQNINKNSFDKIKQHVIDVIEQIKQEKQKRLEEKLKKQEERRRKQEQRKKKEEQTVKELFTDTEQDKINMDNLITF